MIKRLLLLAALLIARYHFETLSKWAGDMLQPVSETQVGWYERSGYDKNRYLYPVMQHVRAAFYMERAATDTSGHPTNPHQVDMSTVRALEKRTRALQKENQRLRDKLNHRMQHEEDIDDSRLNPDEEMISRHQAMTIR